MPVREYNFKCKVNGNMEKKVVIEETSYYAAEEKCKAYLSENFRKYKIIDCVWVA